MSTTRDWLPGTRLGQLEMAKKWADKLATEADRWGVPAAMVTDFKPLVEAAEKALGVLETERFITSIKSNNFDYTEWHRNLWKDLSIEEIHHQASLFEQTNHKD